MTDVPTAVADPDDAYLEVQLRLAQRRSGREEPARAAFWPTLAVTFAEEQARRTTAGSPPASAAELHLVLDELVRDADVLRAEFQETGGPPAPATDDGDRSAPAGRP
ncbi:MAG: hypothetical protein ACRD1K_19135 [Acidimicrobiales bacterium]